MYKLLNYPFDSHAIIRKKTKIKRYFYGLENINKIQRLKIAIIGGSTTSEIKDILELFLLNEKIRPEFYESEYNKYYEDVMFENDELIKFKPDIIYIHITNKNIEQYPDANDSPERVNQMLEHEHAKLNRIWNKVEKTFNSIVIQNNYELPYVRSLGNLDGVDYHGKSNFLLKLNQMLAESASKRRELYINDINYLSALLGLSAWYDRQIWHLYRYAVSYEAIPLIAKNISAIIKSIYGKSKKCLVLDLDNTLWGGVIGELGKDGIEIGYDSPSAEAYSYFQDYIKQLKLRGVTLAICSKNEFENAKEGFENKNSLLKFNDFTVFKANWDPKNINIEKIIGELNIGEDSLVFVDDNAAEREIVRQNFPDLEVPEIGENVIEYIDYIDKSQYFEPASISDDDVKRNDYYKGNIKREETRQQYTDYNEYLRSLNMTAEINRFAPAYLERITQLVNKTNQFNLTMRRYNYSEIEEIFENKKRYLSLYGTLTDKFGPNGLVSIIIAEVIDDELHILLWIMSCRVFKRNFEFAMFDELVAEAKKRKINKIIGYYKKGEKNSLVKKFYEQIEFNMVSEKMQEQDVWQYVMLPEYELKNKIIEIK